LTEELIKNFNKTIERCDNYCGFVISIISSRRGFEGSVLGQKKVDKNQWILMQKNEKKLFFAQDSNTENNN
jgi:hypothetical protein